MGHKRAKLVVSGKEYELAPHTPVDDGHVHYFFMRGDEPTVTRLLLKCKLVATEEEAKRAVSKGWVYVDEILITSNVKSVVVKDGMVVRLGLKAARLHWDGSVFVVKSAL